MIVSPKAVQAALSTITAVRQIQNAILIFLASPNSSLTMLQGRAVLYITLTMSQRSDEMSVLSEIEQDGMVIAFHRMPLN